MTNRIFVAGILLPILAASTARAAMDDDGTGPTVVVTPVPSADVAPPPALVTLPPAAGTTVAPGTQIIVLPPPPVVIMPAPAPPAAVAPPSGYVVPQQQGGMTELHFTSHDGEPYVISVYNSSPDVEDYEAKCMTPCVLDVANGSYEFMAGRHRTFQVFALGGVQYWSVEDNNLGGIITGAVITGLGGIVAFGGIIALGVESGERSYSSYDGYYTSSTRDTSGAWTTTGIGLGSVAVGLTIWLLSYGMAKQVAAPDGYIPVGGGVGLLPTLLAMSGTAGDRELGLGLALRF